MYCNKHCNTCCSTIVVCVVAARQSCSVLYCNTHRDTHINTHYNTMHRNLHHILQHTRTCVTLHIYAVLLIAHTHTRTNAFILIFLHMNTYICRNYWCTHTLITCVYTYPCEYRFIEWAWTWRTNTPAHAPSPWWTCLFCFWKLAVANFCKTSTLTMLWVLDPLPLQHTTPHCNTQWMTILWVFLPLLLSLSPPLPLLFCRCIDKFLSSLPWILSHPMTRHILLTRPKTSLIVLNGRQWKEFHMRVSYG